MKQTSRIFRIIMYMGKFLKNFKSPNALLAIFIGVSLVVFTAVASGSFHHSSDGGILQNAPIQTQQHQAAPLTENHAALQSARKGKTAAQSQTVKRADISAISGSADTETKIPNSFPVTVTSTPVLTNNNAGANLTSATTTHFSVSGGGGDDGSWDDNRGDDGGDN